MTEAERRRRVHVDELTRAVRDIADAQARLDKAIDQARQGRLTWTLIGKTVGITKQGARQKLGL